MVSDLAKWRVFAVALNYGVKKWLRSLTPISITFWQQLSISFPRQFQATKPKNTEKVKNLEVFSVMAEEGSFLDKIPSAFSSSNHIIFFSTNFISARVANTILQRIKLY